MKYVPSLAGEWKPLFRPEKNGTYVNDHSLIQAENGDWHLFGITSFAGNPSQERYFVHAVGKTLTEPMEEAGRSVDTGMLAWAPGVIRHGDCYYMFYGPSPTRLAVSPDLYEWMGYEIQMIGNPPLSCHRDHMVLKINEYTWVMYVSGVRNGYSCISCLVSNDLLQWRFVQYALTSAGNAPLNPGWGAFESPYVVKLEDYYYLFLTYTDCKKENYQNTLVFRSSNPYDFGCYTGDNEDELVIAHLPAHAGEVIQDRETGQYALTACGWNGFDIPCEGGVAIAPLRFQPE